MLATFEVPANAVGLDGLTKGTDPMSAIVTGRIPADTEKFRRWIAESKEVTDKISADARAKGCIHHLFAVGDGYVLIIDEWNSAEAFQEFFESNPDIPKAMQDAGAKGEPEITFAELIDNDRF
jgi:heme-degrading monooxygenase HmoA